MSSVLLLSGCMLSPLFQAPGLIMTGIAMVLGLAACGGGGSGGGGGGTTTTTTSTAWPAVVSLSWLAGGHSSLGLMFTSWSEYDAAGVSVSAGGDVTGDGKGDLLIGAPAANLGDGRAYLIFGGATLTAMAANSPVDIGSLSATQGITLDGPSGSQARAGTAVLIAGDINGDSYRDVVIGGPYATSGVGGAWVLMGNSDLLTASSILPAFGGETGSTFNGYDGFMIQGTAGQLNRLGTTLASGDLNHDGKADLIFGAPFNPSTLADHATVLLGAASQTAGTLSEGSVGAFATLGFCFVGATNNVELGYSLATGHINGDSVDDLVIGAPQQNSYYGEVQVIFGVSSGNGGAFPTSSAGFNSASVGTVITGPGEGWTYGYDAAHPTASYTNSWGYFYYTGQHVAVADIDGDGLGDVITSAYGYFHTYNYTWNGEGFSYSFGGTTWTDRVLIVPGSALAGTTQFDMYDNSANFLTIQLGKYEYVSSLATADVNGDGHPDIIIGVDTSHYTSPGYTTAAYVVFGGSKLSGFIDATKLNGTGGFKVIERSYGYRYFRSVAVGDVSGDGIPDVVLGSVSYTQGDGYNNAYGQVYVVFGLASGATFPGQSQSTSATAPTGVTATTGSACVVNVNWNSVSGASGYKLYWATKSGSEYPSGTVITGIESTSYALNTDGLIPYIEVTSVVGGVESSPSLEVTALPGGC